MTDPTPLQLMDRLLDALKEAGIGWVKVKPHLYENGVLKAVCISYALLYGKAEGILTDAEFQALAGDLSLTVRDHGFVRIFEANDSGWDFARFREELARREGEDA